MSKLAHSNQETMDLIEARERIEEMDAEATMFALYLLMPGKLWQQECAKIGAVDIDDTKHIDTLAKKFRVSRGAVYQRLRLP